MRIRICDAGAVGDGKTKNTDVIQNAIDCCTQNGGGTVFIDHGTYVCGTIYMKSNVTLEIDASAVLLASPDIEDYGKDTHHNRYRNETDIDRCWIFACDQSNFAIKGMGELNGNAEAFPNDGDIHRPMMLRFLRCSNIHLEGVRLYNAAAWTTAFLDSSYIWVSKVNIQNEKRYNGDGLDFDGCSHVYVDSCYIKGTDDNICLQSSGREYVTEDFHISNCTLTSVCAGIRIGLKSIGQIRNVTINNCTLENIWREGIKIECTEGGDISNIVVSNLIMRNVSRPVYALLNNRFCPDDLGSSVELMEMPEIGTMRRLLFTNLLIEDEEEMKNTHYRFENDIMGSPRFNGIRFDAEENHKIEDVTLQNIRYTTVGGVKRSDIPPTYPQVLDQKKYPGDETSSNYYPDWSRVSHMDIRNVENLYMANIGLRKLYDDERPEFLLEGCSILKQEIMAG
ncbi:MAG: glycosyl hydrolase family 28 protein [Eubacteriales bacterium]|nr:glycosyl hydrolase family 28 protein [Eubacteriales bacterium]